VIVSGPTKERFTFRNNLQSIPAQYPWHGETSTSFGPGSIIDKVSHVGVDQAALAAKLVGVR
jgi:hypothetical protein